VKIVAKIIAASAFVLLTGAAGFAYETTMEYQPSASTMSARHTQQVTGKHILPNGAIRANAYAPLDEPASAPLTLAAKRPPSPGGLFTQPKSVVR